MSYITNNNGFPKGKCVSRFEKIACGALENSKGFKSVSKPFGFNETAPKAPKILSHFNGGEGRGGEKWRAPKGLEKNHQ